MKQKNQNNLSAIANHISLVQWKTVQSVLLDAAVFPTRKRDNWRAFPWPRFDSSAYVSAPAVKSAPPLVFDKDSDFYYFVFVDGCFSAELSDVIEWPEGLLMLPWSQAIETPAAQAALMKDTPHDSAYQLLNDLNFSDGLFAVIPDDVVIDKPIKILEISTAASDHAQVMLRHDIKVGSGVKLSLSVETSSMGATDALVNHQWVMHLDKQSELNFVLSQNSSAIKRLSHVYVEQAQSSVFHYHYMGIDASWARESAHISLQGEHTQTHLRGVMLPKENAHFSIHTLLEHAKPNTVAKQNFRSVIADSGQAHYQGRVYVKPGAAKTLSTQYHDSVLLSDQGRARSCPQLEVYADDVVCNHGATVGALDEEQLFYLQSRGIDPKAAKALLIQGFVDAIVMQQANPIIRAKLLAVSAASKEGGES